MFWSSAGRRTSHRRTRHPIGPACAWARSKDGRITAFGMEGISNTGAYGAHGLTVVGCSGSKVLPLYRAANVAFEGKVAYTNLPVGGAYRGYGATQASFAVECLMDEMAEAIGMDPVEFRKLNHIKSGESSPGLRGPGRRQEGRADDHRQLR